MARLQKTTNFFPTGNPLPSDDDLEALVEDLQSTWDGGKWIWEKTDTWVDQNSGRVIASIASDADPDDSATCMALDRVAGRQYRLTLPAVKQYARGHRFVYKLDAFNRNDNEYRFTIVAKFGLRVDRYGQSTDLVADVQVPPDAGAGGLANNVYWVRRGAGEWRD